MENLRMTFLGLAIGAVLVATPAMAQPWSASGPGTVNLISDGTSSDAEMSYSLSGSAVFSSQTWRSLRR